MISNLIMKIRMGNLQVDSLFSVRPTDASAALSITLLTPASAPVFYVLKLAKHSTLSICAACPHTPSGCFLLGCQIGVCLHL